MQKAEPALENDNRRWIGNMLQYLQSADLFRKGGFMLTNIKNESIILELSDGEDVGTIGGYCEDGFPIYYANNKMAHMLGYDDVDDLIAGIHGKVANTIHPDDMERVVKELNNGHFYEGMTYKITYRMPKKDGTSLWTVDRGKVIRAEDGRLAIISICNDMTEFIDRHGELERLNRVSKSTLENMPGGYHRCAAEEGYPFLYISDRFCEMFGWTREEIQSEFDNKFINMLHPEDTETTEQYVEMLRQNSSEHVIDAIYRMRGKHGYIWVSDATSLVTVGDHTFYQGTLTDITGFVVGRKNQDQLLREQLNVFDSLARGFQNVFWINIPDGTAKILKLDGYITSGLDKENHKFFDYPTVLKRYIEERVHPEDKQSLYSKLCLEHLRIVFENKSEYIGNYRALVNGEVHYYQYNLTRTADVGFITAGFQNIDAIIEEHLEAERIEKEKEAAHQREVAASYQKLEEMNEIFAASKMGTWNIYLLDGKAPRMEADDLMMELLGVSGKKLTPEEVYDAWFTNIVPASLPSVLQSIEKMKKEGRDENTYIWKHPILGNRYVRCGGTAKAVEGGFALRGYHYDVDTMIREQQKKDKALEEQMAIIDTLSRSFQNVFVANINSGTARVVRLTNNYDVKAVLEVMEKEFPIEPVVKQWVQENVHPDDRERIAATFSLENIRKVFSERDEYSGTYRSDECGKMHHYQFDLRKSDDRGNIVAGFKVIDGIVEEHERQAKREKEHQEVLSHALAAAQQANKAKTVFLNSMSHDIRTPMNAIIGFAALAQSHIDDQKKVQDYLGKISTSSTHLLNLINDILDMSRIESGTVKIEEKALHIPDLMNDLRTMIQSLIDAKNQNLFIDTKNVVHEHVFTDKLRLNQILLNIVGNAIKFTPPGGDITIGLVEKPCILKNYTTYEFSVKDNGIGMSKAYQEHIFETFSRERSTTVSGIQGTGLGMSITKNLVDMLGGDIRVESEEGKGSLFTVTLDLRIAGDFAKDELAPEQLAEKPMPESGKEEKELKGHYYRGRRVLLVEDNELNQEIATALLEELGITVNSVNDGDVAVSTINEAPSDKYDLIFMDIQMPKMDGYTATREIRTLPDNRKANIPIVAMTANAFEEDRRKSFESGMNGHIIKPISMEEIAKVLDDIFAKEGN